MALGLDSSTLQQSLTVGLRSAVKNLSQEDISEIARVVAGVIESNNRQMERDLGWKFANVERLAGR